jgi:hypothetical protein
LVARVIWVFVDVSTEDLPVALRVGVTFAGNHVVGVGADGPALEARKSLERADIEKARRRTLDTLGRIMHWREVVTVPARNGGVVLLFRDEEGTVQPTNVIVLRESDGVLIQAGMP